MFEYFKILELYEGKITLDVSELSPSEVAILSEYKIELNKKMAEEQERIRKKGSTPRESSDVNSLEFKETLFKHVRRRQ